MQEDERLGSLTAPRVFLDFGKQDSETPIGRVIIQLTDRAPRAAENFRQFCTGEFRHEGTPTGYKGCKILKTSDGMIQTGDFVYNNGDGSQSIYGSAYFAAEDLETPVEAYSVVMWNQGSPSTNGCQFLICGPPHPEMNGNFVVVGSVIEGRSVVDRILKYSNPHGLGILESGEM